MHTHHLNAAVQSEGVARALSVSRLEPVLLRLQRMAGNSAVARALAGRPVQRSGSAKPDCDCPSETVVDTQGGLTRPLAALQRYYPPETLIVQRQPEIRVSAGTTSELRSELARLRAERERASGGERDRYDEVINRLQVYIAERGNSTLGDCAVRLQFDGRRLTMNGPIHTGRVDTPSLSFAAVSGKPNAHGDFDYSPSRQHVPREGPIPEGTYWLDPDQMEDLWLEGLVSGRFERAWGSHRITIHPFDATATFGRGGFFIHGGAEAGSAGCIDLTGHMEQFAVALGNSIDGRCKVKLDVRYASSL